MCSVAGLATGRDRLTQVPLVYWVWHLGRRRCFGCVSIRIINIIFFILVFAGPHADLHSASTQVEGAQGTRRAAGRRAWRQSHRTAFFSFLTHMVITANPSTHMPPRM